MNSQATDDVEGVFTRHTGGGISSLRSLEFRIPRMRTARYAFLQRVLVLSGQSHEKGPQFREGASASYPVVVLTPNQRNSIPYNVQ